MKQGYRVVLTYNLIVQGDAQATDVQAQDVANLTACVRTFWHTPAAPRWTGAAAGEPPDRLVYLLDHQYTASGLSWARLKGADATRVAALRRVAEQLDAEIFLVLADVHETWSAEYDYQDHHYWNHADDDEELPEATADDSALGDLIDSDIELRHWIAADGSKLASQANGVADSELCFTRASVDCTPFQAEHEGYMGNYGNTVDRWYHRAAVVMWPRERAFVIRARQSPSWAMTQIANRFKAGDHGQAQAWARQLLPFWKGALYGVEGTALLHTTLPVAATLDDADTAAVLLAPFSLQQLAPKMAPRLLRLLDRYGLAWSSERLHQWATCRQLPEHQLAWLARTLPTLIHACMTKAAADGPALAVVLLKERWHWLQIHIGHVRVHATGHARIHALANTSPALLSLIRSSRDAGQSDLQNQILETVLSTELPLAVPLGVLRAAGSDGADLARVHAHCMQTLAVRLAQPERADDDWSIPPSADCTGELGDILARFLRDPAERRMEWPLAKERRQIIHQLIDRHELPVRHETRRTGRPYTLVLDKTPELFKRAATERRLWAKELAWLQSTADRFSRHK